MDNWRWVYKRNELIDRIRIYRDSHPESKEILEFLLDIIYLLEKK